ncbi:hypothetical protein M2T75_30475, partial [Klebsiella pneumoniae]|nr:hypothetical protein [Klebsiella pneumoniae]
NYDALSGLTCCSLGCKPDSPCANDCNISFNLLQLPMFFDISSLDIVVYIAMITHHHFSNN